MTTDYMIVAYQLQVIASVSADVRQDVTVDHPLGDHRKSAILKGIRDSNEIENVGMRQILPQGGAPAKPLHRV